MLCLATRRLSSCLPFCVGKLFISGSTVVAVITAANLLQVAVAEQAAVKYLIERLDPGNVLDALSLGTHLATGAAGKRLQQKSLAYIDCNLPELAAEPPFLALPVTALIEILRRDELQVAKEAVFAATLGWVKHAEKERAALSPTILRPALTSSAAWDWFAITLHLHP